MDPVIGVLLGLLPVVPVFFLGLHLGRWLGEGKAKAGRPAEGQLWVLQGVGTVLVLDVRQIVLAYKVVEPMVPGWRTTKQCHARIEDFMAYGALLKQPPSLTAVLEGAKEVV